MAMTVMRQVFANVPASQVTGACRAHLMPLARVGKGSRRIPGVLHMVSGRVKPSRDGLSGAVDGFFVVEALGPQWQPITPAQALHVLPDLVECVGAMHCRGIVHCNICPSTVLYNGAATPPFRIVGFEDATVVTATGPDGSEPRVTQELVAVQAIASPHVLTVDSW